LEIQPSSVDKAAVVKAILRDLSGPSCCDPNVVNPHIGFILCIIGDTKSDESIFALLNEMDSCCITSTVGKKKSKTKAKYYVERVEDVRSILETLTT
jgi:trehalose-6-phosphatase